MERSGLHDYPSLALETVSSVSHSSRLREGNYIKILIVKQLDNLGELIEYVIISIAIVTLSTKKDEKYFYCIQQ